MKLTLTDDNGVLIEQWYLPDEETTPDKVRSHIDGELPAYLNREEYDRIMSE